MKIAVFLAASCLLAVPASAQKPDRPLRVFVGILDSTKVDSGFSHQNYTSLGVSYDLKVLSLGGQMLATGLFYDSSSGRDKGNSVQDAFVWGVGAQARMTLPVASSPAGRPFAAIGVGSFRNSQSTGETTTRETTIGTKLTLGYEFTRGFIGEISYLRLSKNELMQYRIGYRF